MFLIVLIKIYFMMIATESVYNVVILHYYFYNYLFRQTRNSNSIGTFLGSSFFGFINLIAEVTIYSPAE